MGVTKGRALLLACAGRSLPVLGLARVSRKRRAHVKRAGRQHEGVLLSTPVGQTDAHVGRRNASSIIDENGRGYTAQERVSQCHGWDTRSTTPSFPPSQSCLLHFFCMCLDDDDVDGVAVALSLLAPTPPSTENDVSVKACEQPPCPHASGKENLYTRPWPTS